MEGPQYTSPIFKDNILQTELNDYFNPTSAEESLGINYQDIFQLGGGN